MTTPISQAQIQLKLPKLVSYNERETQKPYFNWAGDRDPATYASNPSPDLLSQGAPREILNVCSAPSHRPSNCSSPSSPAMAIDGRCFEGLRLGSEMEASTHTPDASVIQRLEQPCTIPPPKSVIRDPIPSGNSVYPVIGKKRSHSESNRPDGPDEPRWTSPSFSSPPSKLARTLPHFTGNQKKVQRTGILDLPVELLASIITLVVVSPPLGRKQLNARTQGQSENPNHWTLGARIDPQDSHGVLDVDSVFGLTSHAKGHNQEPLGAYYPQALYPSRMLNALALTCHKLRSLVRLSEWDARFWKPAAKIYYAITYYPKVLPDSLDLIQGFLPSNQTSWRNFLACTIQYVDTSKRGVESFGTKAGCRPARGWQEHQAVLRGTETPKPKRLMMLCRQPGPDIFDIAWDSLTETYIIAMGLDGGKSYASVDRNGQITPGEELPRTLVRSLRGLFPVDILESKDDRFSILKIRAQRPKCLSSDPVGPSYPDVRLREVLRWNLTCVPEVVRDSKARIARCASWGESLCFTLFKQNFADPTAPLLDPPEDSTLYCIEAVSLPGVHCGDGDLDSNRSATRLLWSHDFTTTPPTTFDDVSLKPEPAVCHIAMSASYVAILVRWNTRIANRILDEFRELYVIGLGTGRVVRRFTLPPFAWDFRHNDMGHEYNQIRHDKLTTLYNDAHATHRATRVHDDKIVLIEKPSVPGNLGRPSAKIITGSHDYCNWVWDLDQASDSEPSLVLDDFYWDRDTNDQQRHTNTRNLKRKWDKFKERAGWWCSTPNQVLDFWHDLAITPDGRFFSAIRAGRTFIWDLGENGSTIRGYSCDLDDICPGDDDAISPTSIRRADSSSLERYLGRPTESCEDYRGHAFIRWFEYKGRIPEQGLWMVFDDWSVVYLDRNDILEACGLSHRDWVFSTDDFESINKPAGPNSITRLYGPRSNV